MVAGSKALQPFEVQPLTPNQTPGIPPPPSQETLRPLLRVVFFYPKVAAPYCRAAVGELTLSGSVSLLDCFRFVFIDTHEPIIRVKPYLVDETGYRLGRQVIEKRVPCAVFVLRDFAQVSRSIATAETARLTVMS